MYCWDLIFFLLHASWFQCSQLSNTHLKRLPAPKSATDASFVKFFRCLNRSQRLFYVCSDIAATFTRDPVQPFLFDMLSKHRPGYALWISLEAFSLNPHGGPTPHYPSFKQCPSCSLVLPTVCMLRPPRWDYERPGWRHIKVVWILMRLFRLLMCIRFVTACESGPNQSRKCQTR